MFDLVTIFLTTVSAAFIAVRFYRAIDGWQGFRHPLVGHQKKPSKMSLKALLGLISRISEPKQEAKTARLRSPKNGVEAPWGW